MSLALSSTCIVFLVIGITSRIDYITYFMLGVKHSKSVLSCMQGNVSLVFFVFWRQLWDVAVSLRSRDGSAQHTVVSRGGGRLSLV